ncbi:MAG: hypothetical protein LLG04_01840 [Parachlamydia sp.]|nr:hypothetical protein [Parachlamydia sp.]
MCFDRIIEVIWLTCRHMYCTPCSDLQKSKSCPNCKQTAATIEKLFFANETKRFSRLSRVCDAQLYEGELDVHPCR